MLDWLSGKSDDSSQAEQEPETPAHLFAVKAFKSAIFGTPGPTNAFEDEDKENSEGGVRLLANNQQPPTTALCAVSNIVQSPAKGILLTPGTTGARRKTVSWGACKEQTDSDPKERRKSLEEVARFSSKTMSRPSGQVNIRRSLFNEKKDAINKEKQITEDDAGVIAPDSHPANLQEESDDQDVTHDLSQPRSMSGKHWMEAYHRDHNVSKLEMKKLIRYSQVAKDHAAKRERETSRLKQRFQKSDERVLELEDKVRSLEKSSSNKISEAKDAAPLDSKHSKKDPQLVALEKAAKDASETAARLENENQHFKRTILRVKEEMAKYEERHKTWVDQRKRKDERHAESRKALREKILLQKSRYAEQLREVEEEAQREKASLQREIEFLRGEVTSLSPAKYALPSTSEDRNNKFGAQNLDKRPVSSRIEHLRQGSKDTEPASSPTILESHLSRAIYSQSPRPLAIPGSVSNLGQLQSPVPVSKAQRSIIRPRKTARVKPRHFAGGRSPVVMTPDREAAARLRIAQRSAEKQGDKRALLGKGRDGGKSLLERFKDL